MQLHDNKNEPEAWSEPFGLFLFGFYHDKIIDTFIKMLVLSETERFVYVSLP